VKRHGLTPRARITGYATAGVAPRVMGIGPVPAVRKLLAKTGLSIGDFDAIELNEAFAAQSLAVLRQLGLPDDGAHVNPNGGAIALGHPLGASGARLVLDGPAPPGSHRRPARPRHPVHRRRPGRGARLRARLVSLADPELIEALRQTVRALCRDFPPPTGAPWIARRPIRPTSWRP
jgi:hypothetical protein